MKKKNRITSLFFALFLSVSFLLVSSCGGGGGSTTTTDDGGNGTTQSDFTALWTDNNQFGAMMMNKSGEMLFPMTTSDASGNVTAIIGAVWANLDGDNVTVFLGNDGLPTKTVIGDFVLLFSNWNLDANTVDIALIYTPTGYIELFKGVTINTATASLAAKLNVLYATKATCFPTCDTDLKNLAELVKIAALGISLGGCAWATTVSLGAAALPCAGLLISTAQMVVGDEWWLNNLNNASNVMTAINTVQCATGDVDGCVSITMTVTSKGIEIVDETLNNNSDLINTGNVFLTNPATTTGVVQEGGGLPSCTGTYECTPNAYMPCYPDGVKQCDANCQWGSCYNLCGDGICDPTAMEDYNTCPSDCPVICGDGLCNIDGGELNSCPADCQVSSCCVSTGNCPSETPYECPGSCCCCPYGQTCNASSICSAN